MLGIQFILELGNFARPNYGIQRTARGAPPLMPSVRGHVKKEDYDNPAVEERWCAEQRTRVEDYLRQENVKHGRISEWPSWHVTPYVSVWAVESGVRPDRRGWWVISGDLPTDYLSGDEANTPREAVRAIATRWFEISQFMKRREQHPTVQMGTPDTWPELGPLLEARATILNKWVEDESIWADAL